MANKSKLKKKNKIKKLTVYERPIISKDYQIMFFNHVPVQENISYAFACIGNKVSYFDEKKKKIKESMRNKFLTVLLQLRSWWKNKLISLSLI